MTAIHSWPIFQSSTVRSKKNKVMHKDTFLCYFEDPRTYKMVSLYKKMIREISCPDVSKFFFNLYSYGTGNLSCYDFRLTLINLYLLTTFRFLWFPRIFVDNLIENEAVYYNNHCKKKSGSPLNFFSKINLRINLY